MGKVSVNPQRADPYKNFKFQVKWNGRYVAGVSKIDALSGTMDPVEYREGGDPSTRRKCPGPTKYNTVTLERGVIHDTEFGKWANAMWNRESGSGADVSLADIRRDIIIEMYNKAGQLAIVYKLYRCWPSECQALPELDAGGNQMAIETLTLENEGWERDSDVAEPPGPTCTTPE